jgi:hypothetical protein
MRAIRVTVARRHEGVRVAIAMSPSVLDQLVANGGEARFDSVDKDVELDLVLQVGGHLNPEDPADEFSLMEFESEPEAYEPIVGEG